jgi:1-deoxy-D-xylulose-5-phosphate reductoisomerase
MPKIGKLDFFEPDYNKFECLKLAFDVLEAGGTAPCVLNAANEIAVEKFLNSDIKFSRIPVIIEKALNKIGNHQSPDLDTIFDCDLATREFARTIN